jgi:hypothetical protein
MRWQRLFDDLEGQAEQAAQSSLDAEIADRTRRELARVRLADRLRAAGDRPVQMRVLGLGTVTGTVEAVGPDWVLLARGGGEIVVSSAAIMSATGLGSHAAAPGSEGFVAGRLGLGYALRRIARDRSAVIVTVTDGSNLRGVVGRVGADAFDLADHSADAGRVDAGPHAQTIPFAALAAVQLTL